MIKNSDVFVDLENQQRQSEDMIKHLNNTIEVLRT